MKGLTAEGLLKRLEKRPIIAAVRDPASNRQAIRSPVAVISMISTSIFELDGMVKEAHEGGKAVLLHIDLAEGLGRDDAAVRWCVERLGVERYTHVVEPQTPVLADREAGLEDDLRAVVGPARLRLDSAGWLGAG